MSDDLQGMSDDLHGTSDDLQGISDGVQIVDVETLDARFEPQPWSFADENREAIAAHWARLLAEKPALFNGKVLLLHRWSIADGVFSGGYLMTDYASFLAWRDFGHPDRDKWNGFAMAALTSAEDHFLLGEMAERTANAGAIYFAAGTPDANDIAGDTVDLSGSVTRELEEETGLGPADVASEPGWTIIVDRPRIAMMKRVRSPLQSIDLKAKIERFLASEQHPELTRMHIVASRDDIIRGRMPAFQAAYLEHALRR
jgi:8-oxo-dGTP pyrophosphatase MutT (NUDIX family)